MRDPSEATGATHFPARRRARAPWAWLVRRAPGPEAPDTRDRAGAQLGMMILIGGGAAFWIGLAAAAIYLLR